MMPRAPIPESTSPSLEVERAVFDVQFCAILGVGGGGEGVGELLFFGILDKVIKLFQHFI